MNQEKNTPIVGIVTSRNCPTCGHHEIGITTRDGAFKALQPGTLIQVLEGRTGEQSIPEMNLETQILEEQRPPEENQSVFPWVPDPLRGEMGLRLKYAVFIDKRTDEKDVSGQIYQAAYLKKLEDLIEKETLTPLPVLLDQLFAAPHLASGNPRQIAQSMWRDLDEIRKPALLVREWLENKNEECLKRLISPKSLGDLRPNHISNFEMEKELETLNLEEFLNLLI